MNNHHLETASAAEQNAPASMDNPTAEEVIVRVCDALRDLGHPDPLAWIENLRVVQAAYAQPANAAEQIFLINRCWRLIIGEQVPESDDVRYCLIDPPLVSPQNWWASFEQGVLPCIVKHSLPLTRS